VAHGQSFAASQLHHCCQLLCCCLARCCRHCCCYQTAGAQDDPDVCATAHTPATHMPSVQVSLGQRWVQNLQPGPRYWH
jgi:hypothetical protein